MVRHREDTDDHERKRDPVRSAALRRRNRPLTCGDAVLGDCGRRSGVAGLCESKRAQSEPSCHRAPTVTNDRRENAGACSGRARGCRPDNPGANTCCRHGLDRVGGRRATSSRIAGHRALSSAIRSGASSSWVRDLTSSRRQLRAGAPSPRQRPVRRAPSKIADARAALDERPSLLKARLRCVATVRGDSRSWSAIWPFVNPVAAIVATSSSRCVSDA